MTDKRIKRLRLLAPLIFITTSLLLITVYSVEGGLDFDLNEPAPDDSGVPSGADLPEGFKSERFAEAAKPDAPAQTSGVKKISRKQAAQLNAISKKILKIFDILKICDTNDFDIEHLEVPETWETQSKALMVLNKVAKQGLIKKSQMSRYKRIVHNCDQIVRKVQRTAESLVSIESQISGADTHEMQQFREHMERSPLDSLRQRFNGHSPSNEKRLKSETIDERHGPARWSLAPAGELRENGTSLGLGKLLTLNNNHHKPTQFDEGTPQMINFL